MLTFRELKLLVKKDKLKLVVEEIEALLNNGWLLDEEKGTKFLSPGRVRLYCFTCSQTNERRPCNLFLSAGNWGYAYVTNITPSEGSSLSHSEYNYVLEEFHKRFVEPASEKLGVRIIFTEAERNIESSMSPELANLLHIFSEAANKATGANHPLDERRWFAFVVAAH